MKFVKEMVVTDRFHCITTFVINEIPDVEMVVLYRQRKIDIKKSLHKIK